MSEAAWARLRDRDLLAGLAFLAIGLGFALGAADYGMGSARRMGPGYFPVTLGGLLALVGLALALRGALAATPRPAPLPRLRPLIVLPASVAVFALTIDRLGLIAACALCVLTAGLASAETRWREAGAIAAGMALFAAATFVWLLGLPMRLWTF